MRERAACGSAICTAWIFARRDARIAHRRVRNERAVSRPIVRASSRAARGRACRAARRPRR
jgi:hypothetical protein